MSKKEDNKEIPIEVKNPMQDRIDGLNTKWGEGMWDYVSVKDNIIAVRSPDFKCMSKIFEFQQKPGAKKLDDMAAIVKGQCITHTVDEFDTLVNFYPLVIPKLFEKLSSLAQSGIDEAKKDA